MNMLDNVDLTKTQSEVAPKKQNAPEKGMAMKAIDLSNTGKN